jgi:hypothetical protein
LQKSIIWRGCSPVAISRLFRSPFPYGNFLFVFNERRPVAQAPKELSLISGGEALGVRRQELLMGDAAFTAQRRRRAAALQGALRARAMDRKFSSCWEHRRWA